MLEKERHHGRPAGRQTDRLTAKQRALGVSPCKSAKMPSHGSVLRPDRELR